MSTDDTLINFHKTLSALLGVAWSHDGKYLACSAVGGMISILDTTTDVIIATYKSLDSRAGEPSFSPDSHLLAEIGDHCMEIWNVLTHERVFSHNREYFEDNTLHEKINWGFSTWSPTGTHMAIMCYAAEGSVNGPSIHIWDFQTRQVYHTLLLRRSPSITCLSWSPDGETLAIGHYSHVYLWQPQKERIVATYTCSIKKGPEDLRDFLNDIAYIQDIYWSPDGSFLACVGYIGIEIWEVATEEKLVTYYEHKSSIQDVQWLMEKATVVSVDQDDLHLWHFRDGRVLQKVSIPYPKGEEDSALITAALSPDLSFLACAGYKGKVPLTEELAGILWIWKHHIEGVLEEL